MLIINYLLLIVALFAFFVAFLLVFKHMAIFGDEYLKKRAGRRLSFKTMAVLYRKNKKRALELKKVASNALVIAQWLVFMLYKSLLTLLKPFHHLDFFTSSSVLMPFCLAWASTTAISTMLMMLLTLLPN